MINLKKQVAYWQDSAKRNFQAAQVLFRNKHYDSCLFFCHLAIEKMLKGLVVRRTGKASPYIHDLPKLAELASLTFPQDRRFLLRTITTFNIAGRYATDKAVFYKQCTPKFTDHYLKQSKELFIWLEKEFQKK